MPRSFVPAPELPIPEFYKFVQTASYAEVLARVKEMEARYTTQAQQQAASGATPPPASAAPSTPAAPLEGVLAQPMRAMRHGMGIPVVFARRRTGGTGGVLAFPMATEALFSNTAATVSAAYHCVLSDGQVGGVQVRDVRNRYSRQGAFSQNYGLRAGTWRPGNQITAVEGLAADSFPKICGGGGNYKGITTIEFSNTYPLNSDMWKACWSVFVRNGLIIERGRLIDGVIGSSDNLCDLLIWAVVKAGIRTESEIDMDQMLVSAKFLEVNELYCNAVFESTDNPARLAEWLVTILPAFMLRETTISGKWAVAPVVRTTSTGAIDLTPLTPYLADWILTEDVIAPGSWAEVPPPAASRRPLLIVATWRQQTSDIHPPLDRTSRIGLTSDVAPAEEIWDLRQYVTSERHAALVAGYRHALRTLGAGTASVRVLRGRHTGYLRQGQLVLAHLQVVSDVAAPSNLTAYWFIERVSLDPNGSESLQLSACPVDADGVPLLAARAVQFRDLAQNVDLPYPSITAEDVPGRSSDTSVPPSTTSGAPLSDTLTPPLNGRAGDVKAPPPRPPANAEPPEEGPEDGDVMDAGGPPSDPSRIGKGRGLVKARNLQPSCKYGYGTTVTVVNGILFGSGGGNYGFASYTFNYFAEVNFKLKEKVYSSTWNATIEMYRVEMPNDPNPGWRVVELGSCTQPPFGEAGRLMVTYTGRCKTRTGNPLGAIPGTGG